MSFGKLKYTQTLSYSTDTYFLFSLRKYLFSYLFAIINFIPHTIYTAGSFKPVVKLIPILQLYAGIGILFFTDVYKTYQLLFLVGVSSLFGVLSVWMIICNVTKINFEPIRLDTSLYSVYAILTFYASEKISTYEVHLTITILTVAYMGYFFCSLANELADHLGIHIFSIKKLI